LVLCEKPGKEIGTVLSEVQNDLLDLGGELSIPGHSLLKAERVGFLEEQTQKLNKDLAPLKEFILPGGTRAAAAAHLARTVCRRAERVVVALGNKEKMRGAVSETARQYLNRLSDLLFVAARALNKAAGVGDVQWRHQRKP
jgi:cob(I)alamin adenosyltransferase